MGSDFTDAGATTSPDAIRDLAVSSLQEDIPGLVLRPGHLMWLFADAVAEAVADCAETFLNAAAYRFRVQGRELWGLPPVEATQAVATVTLDLADPDPDGQSSRTIPAGAQFEIAGRVFDVSEDATGEPGDTITLSLVAAQAGADGSGLSGTPSLLESYNFVDTGTIALSGVTTGGVDAETDAEYEQRLARKLRHIGRPVLPGDFADRARDVAGVARALAIDGYDPTGGGSTGNARTVSIAVIDSAGADVSSGTKTAVQTLLEAEREVNWDVFVIDPTRTTVNIAATVKVWDGFDAADVKARAEVTLAAWLDPAVWGLPPVGEVPEWHDKPTVRVGEAYDVIYNVSGVKDVTALTLNGGTSDVTLATVAGLPTAGTVSVTAS